MISSSIPTDDSESPDHLPETLVSEALAAAARGWPVVPLHGFDDGRCTCKRSNCRWPGGHPVFPDWRATLTTDPVIIRRWFNGMTSGGRPVRFNVGLVTGPPSGLVVLDIRPGDLADYGLLSYEELGYELPPTVEARTGNGGRSLYFRHPGGCVQSRRLRPGLYLRADGRYSYAVAPGSADGYGRPYEWLQHPDDVPLAPLPEWLLAADTGEEEGRPVLTVRERPEGWSWVVVNNSVEHCGNGVGLICRTTGRPSRFPKPCRRYQCQKCALQRAEEVYAGDRVYFRRHERIWVAVYRESDTKRNTLNGRASRAGAEFRRITRDDGRTWLFATHDLSGRKPPTAGAWVGPDQALGLEGYSALCTPGVEKVSGSDGWPPPPAEPPRTSTGRYWSLGMWPPRTWEAATAAAYAEVGLEEGDEITEVATPAAFRQLVQRQLDRLRHQ